MRTIVPELEKIGFQVIAVPTDSPRQTDGKIRFEHVNPDYKSRPDPDVLLAMAKAALKK